MARLDAVDDERFYVVGDPGGTGWHRLAEALDDDSILDQWYRDVLEGEAEGWRDLAGACLASYLGGIVADTAITALTTEGRVWSLAAGALAVHQSSGGSFDRIAVRRRQLRVLPGDPAADHPDTEVLDGHALRSVVADELTTLATAIFAAVRRRVMGSGACGATSSMASRSLPSGRLTSPGLVVMSKGLGRPRRR